MFDGRSRFVAAPLPLAAGRLISPEEPDWPSVQMLSLFTQHITFLEKGRLFVSLTPADLPDAERSKGTEAHDPAA
ncbi:MAG TPA: hypothetical protein VGG72_19865 [Bryobacteraceae bacterium]